MGEETHAQRKQHLGESLPGNTQLGKSWPHLRCPIYCMTAIDVFVNNVFKEGSNRVFAFKAFLLSISSTSHL